jgi:esterase FrsA
VVRAKEKGLFMKISQIYSPAGLLVFFALISASAFAQKEERRERTIDEIKVEAIHRAEVGQYPLIGLDPADVKEAFESIHTKDKDEWAAAFMRVGDRYFNEAQELEKSDPKKADAECLEDLFVWTLARSRLSGQAALL